MSSIIKTTSRFSLRQLTSSSDKDFAAALNIYRENTPAPLRTNSNEIAHWLDNPGAYQKNGFLVLGFYCGKKLIGFAQMACLATCKVLAIDYLAIDEAFRKHHAFFAFVECAKSSIVDLGFEVRYIVGEIGKFNSAEPPEESRKIIRLLKMAGFKVAKAAYYQPQLGEKNAESEMDAILMVYVYGASEENCQSQLTKATYLQIVEGLYYEHYLRWYEPHVSDIQKYKADLARLLKKIDSSIKKQYVELNGHHSLFETGSAKTVTTPINRTAVAGIGLLIVLLGTAALSAVQLYFGLPLMALVTIFLFSLLGFAGASAISRESPTAIFKETVRLIKWGLRQR